MMEFPNSASDLHTPYKSLKKLAGEYNLWEQIKKKTKMNLLFISNGLDIWYVTRQRKQSFDSRHHHRLTDWLLPAQPRAWPGHLYPLGYKEGLSIPL